MGVAPCAMTMTPTGTFNSVCSLRAGYQALPEDIRKRADGKQTANVILGSAFRAYGRGVADTIESQKAQNPTPAIHPLVRTHPVNGTKALYFNPLKTETILSINLMISVK